MKKHLTKILAKIKHHKLLTVLTLILLLTLGNMAYNRYLDWDNAQMIKGLAKDFPALVSDIEQATGLDLEIKSNCGQTQEKFSAGVKTCELVVVESPIKPALLEKQTYLIENEQSVFIKSTIFMNKQGYDYNYRNKNSCDVRYEEYMYISCLTGVRERNQSLAQQAFADIN